MKQAKNPIQASKKTLQILEVLVSVGESRVTDIASHLDIDNATVHHHLSTLEELGYVISNDSEYRVSMQLFEMGESVRRTQTPFDIVKPEIDNLAEETGEVANFMTEEGGRGIYVYIAQGERAVHLDTQIGTRQYLHTSALGKAILAHLSECKFNTIIDRHGLPHQTSNTVTDLQSLEAELKKIQNRGVAFDGQERADGIRCVAAPVMDNYQRLIGAVSVSAPSTRMKGDRFTEEIPGMIKNTANIISLNASYS